MPQEPKKKHSKARKRTRRASIMLKSIGAIKCEKCGEVKLPHQVCKACGFYKQSLRADALKNKTVKVKTEVKVTKA